MPAVVERERSHRPTLRLMMHRVVAQFFCGKGALITKRNRVHVHASYIAS